MAPQLGNQSLLDLMRGNFHVQLDDVCSIYRPGPPVPGGDFGSILTYELLDIVDAHWWTITGTEALILERVDVKAEATVVMPWDTDVDELDELVYQVMETGAIHHFGIVFVYTGSKTFDKRVSVVEYKHDPQPIIPYP